MNVKQLFFYGIFWSASFAATAQTNYTDGVFILNEDWFGHNNSTLNFLNPETGVFDYLVIQNNPDNAGQSLGCTAQFGAIYGDNMYIISKQDQDSGETDPVSGGRVVVADAKTLKIKKRIPVIFQLNGRSAADGRGFVGVDETKGYIGTSNGIFILNLNSFEITGRITGSENPLITGDESNADGLGPLYNNQIGMMLRTLDYVFAIQQDRGVLVINPETDAIQQVIAGCFSTMTQSKDGTIWVGVNSNSNYQQYPYGTVGEQWDGNQLLKINPYTLQTETIDITLGGINQTWYAWTAGSLCASAKENVLYFTFNESKWDWFTTSKMYRYDIDGGEFTLIYDTEEDQRYFYGAGIRVNPLDDKLYAALYVDNINQTYFFYQLDKNGDRLKVYEPIQRYWFPSLFIFPDNYAPEVTEFSQRTISDTQPVAIDLSAMATDSDNLDAAITKRIIANDNPEALLAVVRNNVLTLTAQENQSATVHVTVRFNSNGKTVDRILTATVSTGTPADVTPPSAPGNLTATPSQTSIALSWTASTDNVGVTGYNIYLDGVRINTVTELNYTVTGLNVATLYTLEVEAFDAAGNKSEIAGVTLKTLDDQTGIETTDVDRPKVYPNPFTDYLVIEATGAGRAVIYNLSGYAVLDVVVTPGSNRIETTSLTQGVYILKIGETVRKIVK